MSETVLQVNHLKTSFLIDHQKKVVVDDLNFSLKRGKTLAIVGESGSGKSISAYSILRILPEPPALLPEGEVLYQGKNLLSLKESEMRKIRGSKIAMIFQDPMSALNPVYTIGNQLLEILSLHLSLVGEEAYQKAIQALCDVGIKNPQERFYDYPHQFSGGMKQRIMIAMALLCEPDILIADEPTTALDVTIQAQILDLMRLLQREKNMAILLITHDMGVVAEMADEVIVMYGGHSVEKASVFELFDHGKHPYTQGLFSSLPSNHHSNDSLYHIKGSIPSLNNRPSGCPFHPRCPQVQKECGSKFPQTVQVKKDHQVSCILYE